MLRGVRELLYRRVIEIRDAELVLRPYLDQDVAVETRRRLGSASDVEAAVMGAYRWTNTVPNNNTNPYTGAGLDFEQTRHAFGGEALVAVRPGRGHWHIEFGGGYYPYVYAIADSPGSVFAGSSMVDAHAMLGYEVVPGLRLGLGASYERWTGAGDDTGLRAMVGMHYTPGGVPKGND